MSRGGRVQLNPALLPSGDSLRSLNIFCHLQRRDLVKIYDFGGRPRSLTISRPSTSSRSLFVARRFLKTFGRHSTSLMMLRMMLSPSKHKSPLSFMAAGRRVKKYIPSFSARSPNVIVVRKRGVEPLRACAHWLLKPARLPIPPLPQIHTSIL